MNSSTWNTTPEPIFGNDYFTFSLTNNSNNKSRKKESDFCLATKQRSPNESASWNHNEVVNCTFQEAAEMLSYFSNLVSALLICNCVT